ncbi:lipopolysaccharide heptosyltransferase II [bacterium]|nr:lipopolysaccharide heptosyltransferase II [bacterium]
MNHYRKILISQTAFAGDVILTTPLVQGVKQVFPEAEIHLFVKPDTSNLLKNNPHIDIIHRYDKRGSERGLTALLRWMGILRKEHFDAAFVPHRSLRSAVLVWGAGIPRRIGFRRSVGSFLFTDVVPYVSRSHEVDRNLQLLRVFNREGMKFRPELYPGPEERNEVDRFFNEMRIETNKKMLAMAPGSVWFTKRWLPEGFAEVAHRIWRNWGVQPILVGGKEDEYLASRIAGQQNGYIVNGAGKLSLLASAELIRRCSAILTNDSAPLHLAVAVGTPVVAIFGPTVPAFGFAPYGEDHRIIQKDLDCRPCAIHGGNKCPKGHFRCMKDVTPEEVVEALAPYIAS